MEQEEAAPIRQGRPPSGKRERVEFLLEPTYISMIDDAAGHLRMTRSAFVRQMVIAQIEQAGKMPRKEEKKETNA